jgi:hypothetical protein
MPKYSPLQLVSKHFQCMSSHQTLMFAPIQVSDEIHLTSLVFYIKTRKELGPKINTKEVKYMFMFHNRMVDRVIK